MRKRVGRSFVGLLALAFVLVMGTAVAGAEDPVIQQQMAASYGEKLGLSVDEAQARLDRQDRLVEVADKLRKELGDSYAGIWFDNADGGRMKIGIAASESNADPALVPDVQAILAANDATDDADLVRVGATNAQLVAEHEKIDTALMDELKAGEVSTGIDPTTNAVTVTAATTASSATLKNIEAAIDQVGGDIRLNTASGVRVTANACTARPGDNALFCGNPFRGGVTIGTATTPSTSCTAGFLTLGNSGGSPWLLTAGHCLSSGGTATWGSRDNGLTLHNFGTRHSFTFGTAGDYGITSFSTAYWSTSPYVVYDGATTWNETYHIYDADTSYAGMPICATGSRPLQNAHWSDCGSVKATDQTGNVDGTIVLHLGKSDVCMGVSGNSGGPYYKNGHAYGLHVGIGTSTCSVFYQGVSAALSGSNVHLPG